MLLNRRRFAQRTVAALAFSLPARSRPATAPGHVLLRPPHSDLLAEESLAGFQSLEQTLHGVAVLPAAAADGILPHRARRGTVLVLPAAQNLAPDSIARLRTSMQRGAWLIVEPAAFPTTAASAELLYQFLGITLRPSLGATSDLYIHYRWPEPALVRAFHPITLLDPPANEVIAEHAGLPVAVKRSYGHGGFVFLGSMLGPALRAGEPEAHQIARGLFQRLSDL